MSTSAVEVSDEKVKAMWDKRLTEIFCEIFIKEILKGNRPGTHFTKDRWLKIMTTFEKETGKSEDTGLGWNPIKRTVDASDNWWESRLHVVPEAKKFRTSGIDPEFEAKLDQMFMGIVATGDKAWAPSSGTLRRDFFQDVNNEIPEESEEENMRNDKKKKNPEISSSLFKTGRKKSSKQIGGVARLSSQIEKLCSAADNMSQATYRGQRYHLPDFHRGRLISENTHGRESDDDDNDDDDSDEDGESNNFSGFEMELTRDAIASSLMNSL
ncbi:hypothetical protein Gotur_035751 [Gossypium turneri]